MIQVRTHAQKYFIKLQKLQALESGTLSVDDFPLNKIPGSTKNVISFPLILSFIDSFSIQTNRGAKSKQANVAPTAKKVLCPNETLRTEPIEVISSLSNSSINYGNLTIGIGSTNNLNNNSTDSANSNTVKPQQLNSNHFCISPSSITDIPGGNEFQNIAQESSYTWTFPSHQPNHTVNTTSAASNSHEVQSAGLTHNSWDIHLSGRGDAHRDNCGAGVVSGNGVYAGGGGSGGASVAMGSASDYGYSLPSISNIGNRNGGRVGMIPASKDSGHMPCTTATNPTIQYHGTVAPYQLHRNNILPTTNNICTNGATQSNVDCRAGASKRGYGAAFDGESELGTRNGAYPIHVNLGAGCPGGTMAMSYQNQNQKLNTNRFQMNLIGVGNVNVTSRSQVEQFNSIGVGANLQQGNSYYSEEGGCIAQSSLPSLDFALDIFDRYPDELYRSTAMPEPCDLLFGDEGHIQHEELIQMKRMRVDRSTFSSCHTSLPVGGPSSLVSSPRTVSSNNLLSVVGHNLPSSKREAESPLQDFDTMFFHSHGPHPVTVHDPMMSTSGPSLEGLFEFTGSDRLGLAMSNMPGNVALVMYPCPFPRIHEFHLFANCRFNNEQF